jgi:hypothetical protein
VIKPTLGRVVWYVPSPTDRMAAGDDGRCTALVVKVWSDTCVNLAIFDANGQQHVRTSVFLWQGDGERPAAPFCEWMPYQRTQALRHEALQAASPALPDR